MRPEKVTIPVMEYARNPDDTTVTATQMAAAIAARQDSASRAKALRQIQHWTNNRLLRPSSGYKTGTGNAREYPRKPTIAIAAIFQELASLEFAIRQLRPVARHLYSEPEQKKAGGLSFRAAMNNRAAQLFMGFGADSKGRQTVSLVRLLDLNLDKSRRDELLARCNSSMMINLAPVLERIRWPT